MEESQLVVMRKAIASGVMVCQLCGKETECRSVMQKYCLECSEIRDLQRKNKWAKEHPLTQEQTERKLDKRRDGQIERGKENALPPMGAGYAGDYEPPDLQRLVRVSVPFSYGFSKNAIYSMTSKGHVYLRQQTRGLRDELTLRIREALDGIPFYQAKIYLDILVEKPDHHGDAVNVVDTVCDAVKDATGVDDRWYSIRWLDWRIVKDGGRLIVGIGQEATEDQRICHLCGRPFPLSTYLGPSGKGGRICKECMRVRK